jgi:hypothetical protein
MNNDDKKNSAASIITVVMVFGLAYAVTRYHLVGPVPWKDFPMFILNKGVSLSAFILLACNFGFGPMNNLGIKIPEGWLNARKSIGMTGFLLALIHALMSFLLFSPSVYGKFFVEDGTLTMLGGLSMLSGVIAFVILWGYNMSFQTFLREDKAFIQFITSRKFLIVAMLFGALHIIFMGYEGWLKPEGWHGGMPPVSLVAIVIFVVSYIANLFGRE